MRYRLIFVGRKARDPLLEAADFYAKRLSHYARVERLRVREGNLQSEASAILKLLKPPDTVVVLDERGVTWTTRQLAAQLDEWRQSGVSAVSFVTGGADGLANTVKSRARVIWSLSALTLPHRLAQVVLLEQLYRANTILKGEPYHRD